MISLLVVLEHPRSAVLSKFVEVSEQSGIEYFLPVRATKMLDKSVLVRLSRLNVVDQDASGFAPVRKRFAQELRAIIGPQHIRQITLSFKKLEDSN